MIEYIKNIVSKKETFKEYHISFTRENGVWYVDFPSWPFSKANLAMVAGADTMLDILHEKSQERNHIKLLVMPRKYYSSRLDKNDKIIHLVRQDSSLFGGATYLSATFVKGFNNVRKERGLWLCPVTLTVLGKYPKHIYFKLED